MIDDQMTTGRLEVENNVLRIRGEHTLISVLGRFLLGLFFIIIAGLGFLVFATLRIAPAGVWQQLMALFCLGFILIVLGIVPLILGITLMGGNSEFQFRNSDRTLTATFRFFGVPVRQRHYAYTGLKNVRVLLTRGAKGGRFFRVICEGPGGYVKIISCPDYARARRFSDAISEHTGFRVADEAFEQ